MKKKLLFLVFIVATFLALPTTGKAAEFNFAVKAEIPENQINKDVSYFDLKLDKGAKQTLTVDMRNDTDQEVLVDVAIASATTNINGVVEYSPNDIKPAKSLQYDIEDYVKVPENVKIPAKGSTKLNLEVSMPDQSFDGVMVGGITFKEHQDKTAEEKQGKGVSIDNKFSFVTGLVLQQNTNKVNPEVVLHDVKPNQLNFRNVIMATFENTQPTFINSMVVDAKVSKKGEDKPLYKLTKVGLQFAPNTSFDFPISLEGDSLEPGTYVAEYEIYGNKSEDGQFSFNVAEGATKFANHWTLKKEFTVKAEVAKELNQKDVTIKKENNWWIYALIALVILLIIIVSVLLFIVLKKKDKQD